MKKIFINIIKYFKIIYKIYYWIGTFTINIIKIFIKPKNNLILFISYGGKKFDDSPKAIYEAMVNDSRFDDYDFVWAFQDPKLYKIPKGRIIKADSLKYFITALKARCWITNSAVERGLNFKGKDTFYFNSWHGTPIKKMGEDMPSQNTSFKMKREWKVDLMTSQCEYEADIFSRVFNINKNKFLISGLPRNDVLANINNEFKLKMMNKIGLPLDKKVILYAPTFREYERDHELNCVIAPPIDFQKWKEKIGAEYIVLLRTHYEVAKILNTELNNGFIYDVSDYPIINDLMIASDLLISDYSSIFFDYSILDRPMICFTYDYEKYSIERGLYFDIRNNLYGGSIMESDLLKIIENLPNEKIMKKVREFRGKYVKEYGSSTSIAVNAIYNNIKI